MSAPNVTIAAMDLPTLMLLAFACWTLVLLLITVGIYRWSRILTRRAPISTFRADRVEGDGFYPRAMRAHANCVENLPVFAVIVFAMHVAGAVTPVAGYVTAAIVGCRIAQSIVHVSGRQTDGVVFVRFFFYILQLAGFFWLMGSIIHGVA